jgi:hypothetical protein
MKTLCSALLLAAATLAGATNAARAQSMAGHEHAKSPASAELKVTVEGASSTFSLANLAALPQKTVTVHNEHTKADETYTGVALGDLLAKQAFVVGQATHRKMLRSYIKAEGTDKYWVLYSVTEVEGSEHNADVIVATSMNGKSLGDDGQIKLIDSADKKPQRWVRNLTTITLVTVE